MNYNMSEEGKELLAEFIKGPSKTMEPNETFHAGGSVYEKSASLNDVYENLKSKEGI